MDPARVGRDHGVPRGALPRAARSCRPIPPIARSRASGSSGTTTSRGPYYALRRGEDGAAARLDAELGKLDAAVSERVRGSAAEYGLADIAYVPWVLRARDMLGVSLDAFPALAAWLDRLVERPSIAMEVEVVAAL